MADENEEEEMEAENLGRIVDLAENMVASAVASGQKPPASALELADLDTVVPWGVDWRDNMGPIVRWMKMRRRH